MTRLKSETPQRPHVTFEHLAKRLASFVCTVSYGKYFSSKIKLVFVLCFAIIFALKEHHMRLDWWQMTFILSNYILPNGLLRKRETKHFSITAICPRLCIQFAFYTVNCQMNLCQDLRVVVVVVVVAVFLYANKFLSYIFLVRIH